MGGCPGPHTGRTQVHKSKLELKKIMSSRRKVNFIKDPSTLHIVYSRVIEFQPLTPSTLTGDVEKGLTEKRTSCQTFDDSGSSRKPGKRDKERSGSATSRHWGPVRNGQDRLDPKYSPRPPQVPPSDASRWTDRQSSTGGLLSVSQLPCVSTRGDAQTRVGSGTRQEGRKTTQGLSRGSETAVATTPVTHPTTLTAKSKFVSPPSTRLIPYTQGSVKPILTNRQKSQRTKEHEDSSPVTPTTPPLALSPRTKTHDPTPRPLERDSST